MCSGSVLSRATDFGPGSPRTIWECILEVGLPILDLEIWKCIIWESTLGVYNLEVYSLGPPSFSGDWFWIWKSTYDLGVYSGSRATDILDLEMHNLEVYSVSLHSGSLLSRATDS